MREVRKSETFDNWLSELRDGAARVRILARIDRLAHGNPGDSESVGRGISEMRIHCGPGYRVYFQQRGPLFVLLLAGGDKSTQQQDIETAKTIAAQWSD